MKREIGFVTKTLALTALTLLFVSCNKLKEYDHKPELESLRQGLKTSVAVAYCASLVNSVYEGEALPQNVSLKAGSSLISVKIDANFPLPLNREVGEILIAYQCDDRGGVMSILFGDFDLLGNNYDFYGLYLVPFIKNEGSKDIRAIYMNHDIILGAGSDTIMDLGRLSLSLYNDRMNRFNLADPQDVFVAVKQNFWFVDVKPNLHSLDFYDRDIIISGGGQIAEVQGKTGGVIYHALVNAKYNYRVCPYNPISGVALSQNFKAGGEPFVDLGNSYISFSESCDGRAYVDFSSGKYTSYFKRHIDLDLE